MSKILVVDDEKDITDLLKQYLEFSGFEVDVLNKSTDAIKIIDEGGYDLAILDIMMPFVSGTDIAQNKKSNTPVIFLTAKSELNDKVKGLAIGADDYITKPFDLEELVARVRAVLRRSNTATAANFDENGGILTAKNVTVNTTVNDVLIDGDKPISVTPAQFKILKTLLEHKGHIVSKLELLDIINGNTLSDDVAIIETYISMLRKAIVDAGGEDIIETKRGAGYLVRED